MIKLHVAIVRSWNENPTRDPLVLLQGGPGVASLDNMEGWISLFGKHLTDGDLIVLDQRGTGYSQPSLDCPEAEEVQYASYAENLSTADEESRYFQALKKCQERLVASGIDTAAYTTAANAADVNDLRLALGIKEWNLYGVSYGSRLALTILRDYPEGVRSAILVSVYPPKADKYAELAANGERALNLIFERCAANADCNQVYPNLKDTFYNLVDQLDSEPVSIQLAPPTTSDAYEFVVNGDRLINIFFDLLYQTNQLPKLPWLIYQLQDDHWETLPGMIWRDQFINEWWSEGMYTALECAEEVPFSPPEAIEAANAVVTPRFWRAMNNIAVQEMCAGWETGPVSLIEDQPVVSDIPVLILNGDNDPITTNIWAQMAAETLSNSQYFEFSGFGHAVLSPELDNLLCQKTIVDAFIKDPEVPVDGSCVAEFEPFFSIME